MKKSTCGMLRSSQIVPQTGTIFAPSLAKKPNGKKLHSNSFEILFEKGKLDCLK